VSAATISMEYSKSWLVTNDIEDAGHPFFESISHALDSAPSAMRNFLTAAGTMLVLVAHSGSIIDGGSQLTVISIFRFDSGILTELKRLAIPGASDFGYIPIASASAKPNLDEGYLMISCHFDEINGYQAPTRVYRYIFNKSSIEFSLELVQNLATSGAVKLKVFEAGGHTFAVIACKDAGYQVTKVSNLQLRRLYSPQNYVTSI
jgi:hypothetical protein